MPIFGVLQAGKSSYGGQPVWYGDPNDPKPFTIANLAINGNIWVGMVQSVGPNNTNESTPVTPGGYLSYDGTEPVYYVIADAPNVTAVIYPGVVSVFQPSTVSIVGGAVTNVTEDVSTPAVVRIAAVAGPSGTTAAFSPPANSWLVAMVNVGYFANATPTITVSDTGGHAWSEPCTINNGNGQIVTIWRAPITAAPGSITVTAHNSDVSAVSALQLAVKVVIKANANQSTAAHVTTTSTAVNMIGNIVPTALGSLIYVVTGEGGITFTVISGLTEIDQFTDATVSDTLACGKSAANTTVLASTSFGWSTGGPSELYAWAALEVIP